MTWFDDGGNKPPHEPAPSKTWTKAERVDYCANCQKMQPVTRIHATPGERDRERCNECGRTWPVGRAWPARWRA